MRAFLDDSYIRFLLSISANQREKNSSISLFILSSVRLPAARSLSSLSANASSSLDASSRHIMTGFAVSRKRLSAITFKTVRRTGLSSTSARSSRNCEMSLPENLATATANVIDRINLSSAIILLQCLCHQRIVLDVRQEHIVFDLPTELRERKTGATNGRT